LCQKLIDARSDKGVWRSTYSNAAAARALHAYAQMFSGSSDVWNVQAVLYGTAQPVPRDDRLVVEMDKTGWIENLGEQRVYVQERISGVPSKTIESNSVFDVERALIRLDGTEVNPLDVRTGEILLLRFRVSGVPQPSEYFAVNQLLPAGLEPLSVAQQRSAVKRMHAKPAEIIAEPRHIEVRDDRFLIFPNRIGVEPVTFLVLVQAVTPGTYTFPAVLIQDMYAPELHATGKSSMLKVLP
jgi:uncharacterized protein YfaS (alpha-2-macroglobulin family)